ncbi:RfeB protein [Uncinocarpus reesii 1704]|uniref:RfeB protein n=1 Tax=Uncinocarpus reesii (strain UAMH 1704) TaxID=336963 RepID=C4JQH0_UNCRE|nr:RfeB protein [Uncinocarpus reesii 1704]EEP78469.1 RfeB protein [Uncinocarpus reesii 1704]
MANAPANSNALGGSASAQQQSRSTRRPPRKSTLTQQQKNHKRQRATQDQLVTLEMEFNKNPTPTAAVRERIAEEINMTERSVQIWFQNRRAKIKMIAKRGIETGEDCDSVPESMRQYLALHWDPSKSRSLFNRGYGAGDPMLNAPTSSGKIVISHISCRSLRIGTWRRVGQNTMDLVIFYSPDKSCMTYYINNDSAGYKIEYPFSHIKNIALEPTEPGPNVDGAPPKFGGIVIELNRPPNFYMDSSNSGGFYQCGDFTEDQQATKSLVHHLGGGHPKVLSVQLAKLVSLESFQNRHIHFGFNGFASAPVSPHIIHRPASQPNQFARRQSGIYQENHFGMSLHPPRGHKRQRSRSVPVPVDFSALQTPMPPFHVQRLRLSFQPNPNILAPVPQTHLPVNGVTGALQVDTSPGYNLDFRSYPMSATTGSPSEFASPSLFATTSPPGATTTGSLGSPADMFPVSNDPATSLPDDGLLLSEMYSKQNLNISMPSPPMDDTTFAMTLQGLHDQGTPDNGVDFQGMLAFETVDPMSLGAES